jgi:hypothetical protein
MIFDKRRRTDVPLLLCFGLAVQLEAREVVHVVMRREPTPHRVWIPTEGDVLDFRELFSAVAEELAAVL